MRAVYAASKTGWAGNQQAIHVFPPAFFYAVIIATVVISFPAHGTESDMIYQRVTSKVFADVVQDAEFMITEKNFRITSRLHIGKAIRERGNQTFPEHEVILFCNLALAEKMLEIAPEYINYCPYKLALLERRHKIVVSTRLMPEASGIKELDQVAREINAMLWAMVDYATHDDSFLFENDQFRYTE